MFLDENMIQKCRRIYVRGRNHGRKDNGIAGNTNITLSHRRSGYCQSYVQKYYACSMLAFMKSTGTLREDNGKLNRRNIRRSRSRFVTDGHNCREQLEYQVSSEAADRQHGSRTPICGTIADLPKLTQPLRSITL